MRLKKDPMDSIKRAIKQLTQSMEQIQSQFAPFEKLFEKIQKSLKRVAEELPGAIIELSELGWYTHLDSSPGFSLNLKENLGDLEKVDMLMIQYLDEIYGGYKNKILEDFPDRRLPLEAGFSAHEREEFFLSIPVFFPQIEGIFFDQTGIRYFGTKNNEPKTKKWVKQIQRDAIIDIFLEPMTLIGPYRKVQDFDNPIGINRHDVLHGNSVDYGTKVNGYKVLSLLFYIGEMTKQVKKELE